MAAAQVQTEQVVFQIQRMMAKPESSGPFRLAELSADLMHRNRCLILNHRQKVQLTGFASVLPHFANVPKGIGKIRCVIAEHEQAFLT